MNDRRNSYKAEEATARKGDLRKESAGTTINIIIVLFVISLAIPSEFSIHIGSIKLPIYRILLIATVPFSIAKIMRRKHSGMSAVDLLFVMYCFWISLALMKSHQMGEIWQYTGVLVIETAGAYFLARAFVSSKNDFDEFIRTYLFVVIAILPFAILESLRDQSIIHKLASSITGNSGEFARRPARLGLGRAAGPFEHPILYGVFCAVLLGMSVSIATGSIAKARRMLMIGLATFFSLSTGPLTALSVQIILIVYDVIAKGIRSKWKVFSVVVALIYILIDAMSNRTPFHVFITYLSFRLQSSYNRILIWQYGTDSVYKNPIFGIGLREWERPHWMSSSMDNVWLLISVRYGIPAFVFLFTAILLIFYKLSRKEISPELQAYRKGWMISMGGLIVAGATVAYWGPLYVLLMFMIGASGWLLRQDSEAGNPTKISPPSAPRVDRAMPYSRNANERLKPAGPRTSV